MFTKLLRLKKDKQSKSNLSDGEESKSLLNMQSDGTKNDPHISWLQEQFERKMSFDAEKLVIDLQNEVRKTQTLWQQLGANYYTGLRQKMIGKILYYEAIPTKKYTHAMLQELIKFNADIIQERKNILIEAILNIKTDCERYNELKPFLEEVCRLETLLKSDKIELNQLDLQLTPMIKEKEKLTGICLSNPGPSMRNGL